jgi:hypothetical protein
MPLEPHQFGRIDQVAYPAPAALILNNPVDVSNTEEQEP